MQKDFYLNDRATAAYFEKDWFDHISGRADQTFAPFSTDHLYSDYHELSVQVLTEHLASLDLNPIRFLEVGSSLGRTYYEICKNIQTLKSATLIEPSANLSRIFRTIFEGPEEIGSFTILKGNMDTTQVQLDTKPIRESCKSVPHELLQQPFAELSLDQTFDLVVCSNVIDQCKDPMDLVKWLQRRTAPGGVVLLSCTYQWQSKYIGNATAQIRDIKDVFDSSWQVLGEKNIPFKVRGFERYWMTFLSHVALFRLTPL